jgi:hypothetical protein
VACCNQTVTEDRAIVCRRVAGRMQENRAGRTAAADVRKLGDRAAEWVVVLAPWGTDIGC